MSGLGGREERMKLVIGGYAQGKLDYVLRSDPVEANRIWDGELPEKEESKGGAVVINHLHHWIRARLEQGGCPESEILGFMESCPDCVLICDEIGNGIIPVEAFEREYRERTGRILVRLAGQAEEVERVICGIGQRIK